MGGGQMEEGTQKYPKTVDTCGVGGDRISVRY